jgi:hypothetical protein
MKFLIKMAIQLPAVFFLYTGILTYIPGTIASFATFMAVLLVYDLAEKFLSKP